MTALEQAARHSPAPARTGQPVTRFLIAYDPLTGRWDFLVSASVDAGLPDLS